MAKLSTTGLEELARDMGELASIPDATILEMLTAEAEIVAAAQQAEAGAMLSGPYSKGITAGSITYDKKLRESSDGKCVYVYPRGTRSDGNSRRIAEVAFVNEYGTSKQDGRPFIRVANEKAADAAVEAAARVYDAFLKSKNL